MKKKILGLVMVSLVIGTFGAFAQNETKCNNTSCEQTEKKCHGDKKQKCHGDKKHDKKQSVNPFTGIQLNAEQEQKINDLKAERKANKEAQKKANKEARSAEKKDFDAKVAAILTPEQYSQYQANCEKIKSQKKDRKAKIGKMKKGNRVNEHGAKANKTVK